MAETLTNQEEVSTELNADEQESLQIGEQMEQEQSQMLAGKYKTPADLEKAYLELQSKLGSQDRDTEESEESDEVVDETDSEEQEEETSEEEIAELTDGDIEFLHDMAGGKEGYNTMVSWASENFDAEEVNMYDSVMESGDPSAIYFAVQALVSRYGEANGTDGELLVGTAAANTVDAFKSQAELVAAMSDPRYDNDPAYRDAILQKLDKSDIF